MSRTLHKGPQGGVYYIARSGARVYVERSSYEAQELRKARLAEAYKNAPAESELDAAALKTLFLGLAAFSGLLFTVDGVWRVFAAAVNALTA